jgi:hypothetical protein
LIAVMSLTTSDSSTRAGGEGCSPAVAELLAGEKIHLLTRLPVPRLTALQDAATLLGGRLELADRLGPAAAGRPGAPWLLEAGAVLALEPAERARLRELTVAAPTLLFAADPSLTGELGDAGAVLTGRSLPLVPGGEPRDFTFAPATSALDPFAGLTLRESHPRVVPVLLDPDPRAVHPLIAGDHGAVLGRVAREDGGELWVTVVPPLAHLPPGRILRHRFHPGDFLELLPLLAFLRHALGERGWRRPRGQAAFMIDDPNLRSRRYGWVDYASLRDAGREHCFHTSIAMAAIDAGKTSQRTAALFRGSSELSLVMHGIYHTHHEFAQSVSPQRARRDLGFGLAEMESHRRRHGVACPPVMTFPFSKCSSEWLQAMRDVGLAAAVTGPNPYPFLAELGMLADPMLGMLPAEMRHGGFPVISRSFLTQPREDLLFAAWLGKPLVVYLHHDDLREGVAPLVELARFLNERIDVEWADLGTIAAANYQLRETENGQVGRMFSGRVQLASGDCVAMLKPGADRHPDERIWADGRELEVEPVYGTGVLARLPRGARTILGGPTPVPPTGTRRPLGASFAQGRRSLTELRDRLAPSTARVLGDEGPGSPVSFPAFTG